MNVVIDSRSGENVDIAVWVQRFAELWRDGRNNIERFMDLLSPDVRLAGPGLRTTKGREAGLNAFRQTFRVLPDLTAEVHRWSASDAVQTLFIEMNFTATIGGRRVEWGNVDRFIFRNGLAVERVAFFNPVTVRRAFLRRPSGWIQLFHRVRSNL